jgi:hypothetical protein
MYYCFREGMIWRGLMHDLNKFRPSNFLAYARYFYLKNGQGKFVRNKSGYYDASKTGDDDFDRAWHYHQRTNKHHWQFWTMSRDDGTFRCLDIPHVYIREMLCDWLGAGRAQGTNPNGTYYVATKYYLENRTKMHFTEETREYLEQVLFTKLLNEVANDIE